MITANRLAMIDPARKAEVSVDRKVYTVTHTWFGLHFAPDLGRWVTGDLRLEKC